MQFVSQSSQSSLEIQRNRLNNAESELLNQGQNAVSNRGGSSLTGSGPRGSIPAVTVFGCVRRQRFAPFCCAVIVLDDFHIEEMGASMAPRKC